MAALVKIRYAKRQLAGGGAKAVASGIYHCNRENAAKVWGASGVVGFIEILCDNLRAGILISPVDCSVWKNRASPRVAACI